MTEYSNLEADSTMLVRTAVSTVRDEAIDLLRSTGLLAFVVEQLGPASLAADDDLEFMTYPVIDVHVSLKAADRREPDEFERRHPHAGLSKASGSLR